MKFLAILSVVALFMLAFQLGSESAKKGIAFDILMTSDFSIKNQTYECSIKK